MNIRLRFKLIALLIALSLAGLLVFQGYWLKGLYDTLYKQMEINIEEAMKIADYKELFLRIRAIKRTGSAGTPNPRDLFQLGSRFVQSTHDERTKQPPSERATHLAFGITYRLRG